MKNQSIIFFATALLGGACGDNLSGTPADAPSFPAAPTLGPAIDRMGRPAINTAFNAVLDDDTAPDHLKTTKKDAYNHALAQDSWASVQLDPAMANDTVLAEFEKYLAIYDSVDTTMTTNGCGNALGYTTPAGPNSYATLATVLADDELYVDTTRGTCNAYLSVEVKVATGLDLLQCGGRTLDRDVIDVSYSLIIAGGAGFNLGTSPPTPKILNGAVAHTDYSTTFPYLGTPH